MTFGTEECAYDVMVTMATAQPVTRCCFQFLHTHTHTHRYSSRVPPLSGRYSVLIHTPGKQIKMDDGQQTFIMFHMWWYRARTDDMLSLMNWKVLTPSHRLPLNNCFQLISVFRGYLKIISISITISIIINLCLSVGSKRLRLQSKSKIQNTFKTWNK